VALLDCTRDETPLLDEICDEDLLDICGVVLVDRMLDATLLSEEDRDDECTAEDDNMIVEDDLTTVVEIARVEILDKTILLDGIFEDSTPIEETPEEGAVEDEIVILEELRTTIVDVVAVEMLERLALDVATLLGGAVGDNVVLEELLIPDVDGAVENEPDDLTLDDISVVLELDFSVELTRDDEDEAAAVDEELDIAEELLDANVDVVDARVEEGIVEETRVAEEDNDAILLELLITVSMALGIWHR
jgi:hypothetical protein